MSGVSVLQHFEAYQKARVTFVQAVAEAATRPQNIEVMQNAGVMQLLRPLLLDNVSFKGASWNSHALYGVDLHPFLLRPIAYPRDFRRMRVRPFSRLEPPPFFL